MLRSKAPLPFVLFATVFDLILLWSSFELLCKSTRVVVNPDGVAITQRRLGLERERRIAAPDITGWSLGVGMRSGTTSYSDIQISTKGGRSVAVARLIRDRAEADWLMQTMREALGRTR